MNGRFFSRIESYHLTGTEGQLVDAFQPLSNQASLDASNSKVLHHFSQRRLMNSARQIAVIVKFRPCLHWARLFSFGTSAAPVVPSPNARPGGHEIVVIDPLNDHARRPGFQNVIDGGVGMIGEHDLFPNS